VNRRRFLALLGTGAAGLALAPMLPIAGPTPAQAAAIGAGPGIAIRYIQAWELEQISTRLDVLYGMSVVRRDLACRIGT
jgi:hypothetical protein